MLFNRRKLFKKTGGDFLQTVRNRSVWDGKRGFAVRVELGVVCVAVDVFICVPKNVVKLKSM